MKGNKLPALNSKGTAHPPMFLVSVMWRWKHHYFCKIKKVLILLFLNFILSQMTSFINYGCHKNGDMILFAFPFRIFFNVFCRWTFLRIGIQTGIYILFLFVWKYFYFIQLSNTTIISKWSISCNTSYIVATNTHISLLVFGLYPSSYISVNIYIAVPLISFSKYLSFSTPDFKLIPKLVTQ